MCFQDLKLPWKNFSICEKEKKRKTFSWLIFLEEIFVRNKKRVLMLRTRAHLEMYLVLIQNIIQASKQAECVCREQTEGKLNAFFCISTHTHAHTFRLKLLPTLVPSDASLSRFNYSQKQRGA
jgi:hypothetical protein